MEKNQRGNSGQTLVITALLVALLFISTIYYLWEVGEESNTARLNTLNEHISIVKLGSHHTVLCSLINITHGGETEVL